MFLGKENKVAKIKCNNQSKRGWLRNYIYKKLILTFQYTIHNSIYEKLNNGEFIHKCLNKISVVENELSAKLIQADIRSFFQ